jgi:hypothetical protein
VPTCSITPKQSKTSAKSSKHIKPNRQLLSLHQEQDLVGIYSVPHLVQQEEARMVDIEVDRGMIGDMIRVEDMGRVRVRVIGMVGV